MWCQMSPTGSIHIGKEQQFRKAEIDVLYNVLSKIIKKTLNITRLTNTAKSKEDFQNQDIGLSKEHVKAASA